MNSKNEQITSAVFARLTREHPMLSMLDRRLMDAFERLMLGHPEITDGAISVSNVCTEAGVSRASYYRSPVAAAIKQILATPTTPRPEVENLRTQVAQLKRADRKLRSEKAAEIQELNETIATYADQIQAQALRIAELTAENDRLRAQLQKTGGNITVLPTHETTTSP